MNPISAFFVRNIIPVFFFYGLAFFSMGVALVLASRRKSEFGFVQAIRPLAAFGLLHGLHEWVEMFQKIAILTNGHTPTVGEEMVRLAILILSFLTLMAFGIWLLGSDEVQRWQQYGSILGMVGLWALGLGVVKWALQPPPGELIALADALARYSLGIPGALLGTWALMAQQRTFREHDMPQFGRDLVWCAAALFLYGVIGQLFVRQTVLVPSTVINSTLFLQWFGIPVQLFRGMLAALLAFYMVRALRAFELETRRRVEAANRARLTAQTAALEAERRISQEMERLNDELRLTARELSLLLDLSNLLTVGQNLRNRSQTVLEKIVHSLSFCDSGLILLRIEGGSETLQVHASTGFVEIRDPNNRDTPYELALELGEQCVATRQALCRHLDGQIITFSLADALARQECRQPESPVIMMALPLTSQQRVIGTLVLAQPEAGAKPLLLDEFKLMVGIAQQLGLSIENAWLYQEAQEREKLLGDLLKQAVGAQEAERQRIARELHDATGQSLTAIALGLRGIGTSLSDDRPQVVKQLREVESFSTSALEELRRIIADLRPSQLDDLGLVAALQWYTRTFEEHHSIPTDFTVKGRPTRLPAEYETVLFRITQEALTNIAKHAHASRARVTLETCASEICVTIQDDGCGFDSKTVLAGDGQQSGWGLLGIRERALLLGGHYEIDSRSGFGTRIRASIPLEKDVTDVENSAALG